MVRIALLLLLFSLPALSLAQAQDIEYPRVPADSRDALISDSLRTRFREDATSLALWWINNHRSRLEDRVTPPDDLTVSIYNALARCYQNASPSLQDTIRRIRPGRTQASILELGPGMGTHVISYRSQNATTELFLKLSVARWGRAWARGAKTGNQNIDRWTSMFGLKVLSVKKWKKGWSKILLQSDRPVNFGPLEKLLGGIAGVSIVDPTKDWTSGVGKGLAAPDNDYSEPFFRQDGTAWVFAFTEPCSRDRRVGCGAVLRVENDGAVRPVPIRRME